PAPRRGDRRRRDRADRSRVVAGAGSAGLLMSRRSVGSSLVARPAVAPHDRVRPAGPLRPGLRLSVGGRTVHLRGLRRPPSGPWRWLAILGPGLIAANASNDAGGIATYAQVGAKRGYDLLWLLL